MNGILLNQFRMLNLCCFMIFDIRLHLACLFVVDRRLTPEKDGTFVKDDHLFTGFMFVLYFCE